MLRKANLSTPFPIKFNLDHIEWWTAQMKASLSDHTLLYFMLIWEHDKIFVDRSEIMDTICELIVKKKRFKHITGYLRYGQNKKPKYVYMKIKRGSDRRKKSRVPPAFESR